MSVNTQKKKLQEAKNYLEQNNQGALKSALAIYKDYGTPDILVDLFQTLQSRDRSQQQEILQFLSDITDHNSVQVFIDFLQDQSDAALRKLILSSIWNSKLPFDEHLPFFVMLATQGDFLEALDCLTIIENMTGPFDESQLLESQLLLKEYLEERAPQSDQKAQIMSEIAQFVKEQNEGIDADLLLDNQ